MRQPLNKYSNSSSLRRLLEATWDGDEELVAELLENAHEQAGTDGYHSEAAFSYAIQLAYYNARKSEYRQLVRSTVLHSSLDIKLCIFRSQAEECPGLQHGY